MDRSSNKSTVSRRAKILEELENKGQITVIQLSKMFRISEVTIRNDLSHHEKQNMLIRTRGGAIKIKYYLMGIDASILPQRLAKYTQSHTKEYITIEWLYH